MDGRQFRAIHSDDFGQAGANGDMGTGGLACSPNNAHIDPSVPA